MLVRRREGEQPTISESRQPAGRVLNTLRTTVQHGDQAARQPNRFHHSSPERRTSDRRRVQMSDRGHSAILKQRGRGWRYSLKTTRGAEAVHETRTQDPSHRIRRVRSGPEQAVSSERGGSGP